MTHKKVHYRGGLPLRCANFGHVTYHLCQLSALPSQANKLISSGFKTKLSAWILHADGITFGHTVYLFYLSFIGSGWRHNQVQDLATCTWCIWISFIIRLQINSLTFSNCTMLPTVLTTVDVDYAPLLIDCALDVGRLHVTTLSKNSSNLTVFLTVYEYFHQYVTLVSKLFRQIAGLTLMFDTISCYIDWIFTTTIFVFLRSAKFGTVSLT